MEHPNSRNKIVAMLLGVTLYCFEIYAQSTEYKALTIEKCIEIALNGSVEAREAETRFETDSWEYRLYEISRLPTFSLQSTPLQYNSSYTQRYDFDENVDVYREQNSLYSSLGISVRQNVSLTGGTLTLDTNLDYINNRSANGYSQFSSVPIRIGYSQSLFGFNEFKWNKKVEPLKYRIAEKQYLYARETVVENTAMYFWDYAVAQKEYEMSVENMASTDSLYASGLELSRISAISQADMNMLEIDRMNARNSVKTAKSNMEKARAALAVFIGITPDDLISSDIVLPVIMRPVDINIDNLIMLAEENNPDELYNEQILLEAEIDLLRTKRESGFNASVSASVGFNQAGPRFTDVYNDLSRQSVVGLSVSVPIFDWGNRKGRISVANANLESARLTVERNRHELRQELADAVGDMTTYREMAADSEKIFQLAQAAYEVSKQRFRLGKADTNTLTLALSRKIESMRNYLSALRSYWAAYYKIRRLTLYDFEHGRYLSVLLKKSS